MISVIMTLTVLDIACTMALAYIAWVLKTDLDRAYQLLRELKG